MSNAGLQQSYTWRYHIQLCDMPGCWVVFRLFTLQNVPNCCYCTANHCPVLFAKVECSSILLASKWLFSFIVNLLVWTLSAHSIIPLGLLFAIQVVLCLAGPAEGWMKQAQHSAQAWGPAVWGRRILFCAINIKCSLFSKIYCTSHNCGLTARPSARSIPRLQVCLARKSAEPCLGLRTCWSLPNLSNYTFLLHSSYYISTKGPNLPLHINARTESCILNIYTKFLF